MKKNPTHRITYITASGTQRSNIVVEAETREEAEKNFKKDFPSREVIAS